MTRSPPNLHTMVPRRERIQDVLKVKVKVKGHVTRTLFWLHENRFFYHKHNWIATKLAHDGPQKSPHPGCAQGQGQGQRSRDTHTFYRAMHVVLARYCYRKSSVRPSVRLSVTLRYAEHIGWTSSKLITRIISLGSSLLGRTTSAI